MALMPISAMSVFDVPANAEQFTAHGSVTVNEGEANVITGASFTVPAGMVGVLRFLAFSPLYSNNGSGFTIRLNRVPHQAFTQVMEPPSSPAFGDGTVEVFPNIRLVGQVLVDILGVSTRTAGQGSFLATAYMVGHYWPQSLR